MLSEHLKCSLPLPTGHIVGKMHMSSKCTQHVITGFQAPSPPVFAPLPNRNSCGTSFANIFAMTWDIGYDAAGTRIHKTLKSRLRTLAYRGDIDEDMPKTTRGLPKHAPP